MKRVLKQGEPIALTNYRNRVPRSTWPEMKDDAHFGGPIAYDACRAQLISDQGGLCAFCEIDIRDNDPGSTPFPRTVIKQLRAFDPAQQLYVAS